MTALIAGDQVARLNELFRQTHFLDEVYGGTRGAEIKPILRGRSLTDLTADEGAQLAALLVEMRDRGDA